MDQSGLEGKKEDSSRKVTSGIARGGAQISGEQGMGMLKGRLK